MYICGNINGKNMKSPIKNLTNILLNDHKFGTSVTLMNKDGKWSEVTVTWRCLENEVFFQIWNSIGSDIKIYKCTTVQAMYKKLTELIEKYDLIVTEIERD